MTKKYGTPVDLPTRWLVYCHPSDVYATPVRDVRSMILPGCANPCRDTPFVSVRYTMSKLFTPYNLSGLALKNRVVMAPMTRTRTMNDVPDEVVALYYAQRASAGLLITEGMPVSEEGRGYLYTPGIYNDEHVQGWRKVTQAVHAKGGRIFAQLWHVGRMSHVSLQPGHIAPVSAGTVQAVNTTVFALTESGEPGPVVPSQPRALETHEVKRITADFVHSARLAMEAGFDGVEIMAANGFIFDQFLSSELNTRTDEYGGSVENRQRFLLETIDAIVNAVDNVESRKNPHFSGISISSVLSSAFPNIFSNPSR